MYVFDVVILLSVFLLYGSYQYVCSVLELV